MPFNVPCMEHCILLWSLCDLLGVDGSVNTGQRKLERRRGGGGRGRAGSETQEGPKEASPKDKKGRPSQLMQHAVGGAGLHAEMADCPVQVETTEGQLIAIDVTDDDHPLCQGPTSAWNTYFKVFGPRCTYPTRLPETLELHGEGRDGTASHGGFGMKTRRKMHRGFDGTLLAGD